jgi:hypothetical protein
MLYAESLAYTQPTSNNKDHLSVPELQQIRDIAGHNILIFLDRKLKPESLWSCSKGDLEAVFLLVISTILAVSYAYLDVIDDRALNEVSAVRIIAVAGLRTIQTSSSKDPGYYLQFQAM